MTDITLAGLVDIGGYSRGGNVLANAMYLLGAGRYSPARYQMEMCYPRPDSETSPYAYHRIWQTGEPMHIPVRPMWGAAPHSYKILSSNQTGWTIGEFLVENEFGDLVINDAYGTLSNSAVVAGDHNVVVGVWDATGVFERVEINTNVGNHGFFAAPTATGNGSGSDANNCMDFATAYGADESLSPAKNKILYVRGGDYTVTGGITCGTEKPRAVVPYRNEEPNFISATVGAQINMKSSDVIWVGCSFTNWGDSATFRTYGSYYERQGIWRCKIIDSYGDPEATNNEAGWFIDATGTTTKRPYFFMADIQFINCHEVAALDWYSVKGLIERQTWTTNQLTIEEPGWFPKSQCEYDMRYLRYDNTTATSADGNQGIIMPYNSESAGSRVKAHVRFCFVRCHPSVTAVIWNGAANAGSDFAADGHDDRNTYIGGRVVSRDYGGDLITFTNDVMQNADGGVLPSATGFTVSGADSIGTSGIVDSNGRLVNTARAGLDGHQIKRAG